MSEHPILSIVVQALQREFIIVRNKVKATQGRLEYAYKQVETESAALADHKRDVDMLAAALLANGGGIPPEDPAPQ